MEVALPFLFLAAVVAALRALGPRHWEPHQRHESRDRPDRPDRRVTHYRASGVLPRWDS